MHMPPPIHGASLMGKYLRESELINQTFDCRYINLTIAASIEDVQKFGLKKLFRYISLILGIIYQVISFNPHLVYFTPNACGKPFYKEFPIMVLLKLMGKKVVAHYHNKGVSTHSDRWLDDKLYRFFFYHTKVILLSERIYPDIEKYVSRRNVWICPNGIPETDMLHFQRTECAPQKPVLLFLSNLLVAKGVWTLVDALVELNKVGVDFKCIFAGGESAEINAQQLQSTIKEKGLSDKVSYFGPVYGREKEELLKRTDIFVFPTHHEAFGLVLLEAMQCAIPCIATAEGGILDIIQDGKNGVICQPKDYISLAQAINRLLNNFHERYKIGVEGRNTYLQQYTLQHFYSRMNNALMSVVED